VCAIIFIIFLAVISFLFATSEVLSKTERALSPDRAKPSALRNSSLFGTQIACALVILVAGVWTFAGPGIWELTPLYIGEVASVWALGSRGY
jgi:Na+/H+ antiporter NhaD/arsenite permease-like protein